MTTPNAGPCQPGRIYHPIFRTTDNPPEVIDVQQGEIWCIAAAASSPNYNNATGTTRLRAVQPQYADGDDLLRDRIGMLLCQAGVVFCRFPWYLSDQLLSHWEMTVIIYVERNLVWWRNFTCGNLRGYIFEPLTNNGTNYLPEPRFSSSSPSSSSAAAAGAVGGDQWGPNGESSSPESNCDYCSDKVWKFQALVTDRQSAHIEREVAELAYFPDVWYSQPCRIEVVMQLNSGVLPHVVVQDATGTNSIVC